MNAAAEKPKRGLGRGLDALFADGEARVGVQEPAAKPEAAPVAQIVAPPQNNAQRKMPVTSLIPTPFQPRKKFDETELGALADSIRAHGVLQPLLVRPSAVQSGKYEIIAGERRWRAAQLAQLHEVPVVVQELDDRATLEVALIENIQRADLTPIEEAEGYQRLMDEFGHTQEELAKIVGKSRVHLTNTLRLLSLPAAVRDMVTMNQITAGHARQLVGMEKVAERIAKIIVKKRMSVRQTERFIARLKNPKAKAPKAPSLREIHYMAMKAGKKPKDADVIALEHEMSNLIGLKVEIESSGNSQGGGALTVHFSSLDQLDELLQKLSRSAKN